MLRLFAKPIPLVLFLAFFTAIPIMMAGVLLVQIGLAQLPTETLRLAIAPASLTLHAIGGLLFGLIGPLQFTRILQGRYGRLHRVSGRIFVAAGYGLGMSGLSLLWWVDSYATPLLDMTRGLAGGALIIALTFGLRAAIAGRYPSHRAWMIRAYAIAMGSGTIAPVMFPIYIMTGAPISGLLADVVIVGWWAFTIAVGEWITRRPYNPAIRSL